MKTIPLIAVFVFCFSSSPSAQELPKSLAACMDKAQTQSDMNDCAWSEAKKAAAALEAKYKEALSLTRGGETPDQDAAAVKSLESAQAAWVRYSDAYIEAMFPGAEDQRQYQYGTLSVALEGIARLKLALRQTAAIDDLLEYFKPK